MWDKDLFSDTDRIRDIDLVIPLSVITASNVWTVKRFNMADGAYLEIQFKIETCDGNFGGLGCSFCINNYYTSSCNKYCNPVLGNYTCNTSGNKVCADHVTGENCDICQKEWSGEKCEECAENFFPEKVCNLTCTAVKGRYSCSDLGEKVCNENWKGAECDNYVDNTTGVGNNCKKFNNYRWVAISTSTIAAVSIISTAVLIVYVVVLRRRLKENERSLVTRSNKIGNTEMPEKERDNIQVEYACPDEYEDDETYADVTILENETVQMTRQKYKK